ncbi:MAG: Sir2 silent information regulator family NAD-dependent deacetylase [Clostridia bacterium]|nr:Sir2 silent information regulator family NAD-dependent deacetylase [Clostridia bacterium]
MKDILQIIREADSVLIGAGSGLSTAAGIDYGGESFQREFKEFIEKYGFRDLYTSSFYDFATQEEYWAYWAKHIDFANTGREGTELYRKIYEAVKDKNYFVITTNVDDQFYKTGFDKDKIFRVQGSYRYIQCSNACHNKLYDDKDMVEEMLKNIDSDLKVPQKLVPICPVCGENMEPNLRKDGYFVEDELWDKQSDAYHHFLEENQEKKLVLFEFGAGFNTPTIIRFPFEKFTLQNQNWTLIRFNKDTSTFYDLGERYVPMNGDVTEIFKNI